MKRFYLLFCCCFVFLCSSLYGHIVSVPDTCHLSYIVREDSVRSGQHIVDLACVQIDIVSTFVIDGTGSYEAIIGTNAGGRTDATNANQFYPTFSPVSPNVAAIERFGTHPVNLNTGLASVNIPIFEIKAGAITVPIGLSYHGGGIKVGDVASWVGTSWALNAGGNISRSLNGRPDEYLGSFLEKGVRSYFNPLNPATCEVDRGDLNRLLNNQLDSGGDLFNFTTPSGSGRFILVPQSTDVITIPSDKVKVSYTRSDRTYFSEFKVRDEGGLLYTFNDREFASSTTNGRVSASTTAWLLNRIEGHSPNQRVEFDYENTGMSYSSDYQESQVLTDRLTCNYQGGPSEGVGLIQSSEVYTDQTGKQLKEIRFPSGKVVFERSSQNREDLPNNQYLDHIKIYGFRPNTDDYVLIKSVDLDYDYYLNTDGSKRLFLTKVKLLNNDGSIESQYEMNYNTGVGLPGILSKARDWHGYYNGQTSNSTLIPTQTATAYYAGGTVPVTMGGANRETNAAAMQAGILTRIKYPTGGYSDFEYEANQYLSNGTAKTTGGLRIAKIQTYSGAAALPMVKQYKYGIGEVGYGLLGTTIRPEFLSTTQKFKIEGGVIALGVARVITKRCLRPTTMCRCCPLKARLFITQKWPSMRERGLRLWAKRCMCLGTAAATRLFIFLAPSHSKPRTAPLVFIGTGGSNSKSGSMTKQEVSNTNKTPTMCMCIRAKPLLCMVCWCINTLSMLSRLFLVLVPTITQNIFTSPTRCRWATCARS